MIPVEKKILALFERQHDWSVAHLTKEVGASKQLVHRILKRLSDAGQIQKLGLPPKTIYRRTVAPLHLLSDSTFSPEESSFLKSTFLIISETGQFLEGIEGFEHWCIKQKLPVRKTFEEFKLTREKYEKYHNSEGFIDGTEKLQHTKGFESIYIDQLFYLDFYAIERFGKTKLGTILHYAKQGQNKFLMGILLKEIKSKIETFIKKHKINAVGYIPPTIKREVQLMQYLKTGLGLTIPLINIQKITGRIPVPQKSLNKLEERINNADGTFTIPEIQKYKKILLIDDAVGSGATLNQIAKKIKQKGITKSITGLAIVGSFKGFDVITDV